MTTFFGFALADSMFTGDCFISRVVLSPEQARDVIAEAIKYDSFKSCLNPSHTATIEAAKNRFGIEVEIPQSPPQVALKFGDKLVVMGVRGLPRLTDRHEYSVGEIEKAAFSFSLYEIE